MSTANAGSVPAADPASRAASGGATYPNIESAWEEPAIDTIRTRVRPVEEETTTAGRGLLPPWGQSQFEVVTVTLRPSRSRDTETTSPFVLFSESLDEDSPLDDLLTLLRFGLTRDDGNKLANRLAELAQDLDEDEDSPGISKGSIWGLLQFLRNNPRVRDPSLTASSSGRVRAEWHHSWTRHFVVEFESESDARFVLFVEDPREDGKVVRLSVTCSVASVLEQALPHGVGDWVLRT